MPDPTQNPDEQPLRGLRYRLEDYAQPGATAKRCGCGDSRALHDIARQAVAEAERIRAEVLREAQDEVVAWLSKKAREHQARGRQYAKQADLIHVLADKVRRGAIRLFPDAAEWGVQYPDDRGAPAGTWTPGGAR